MLQFILGPAGTGKTTFVYEQILARAKAKKRSLLLVPEQFASTADLSGYVWLGDEYHTWLKVCSFRTLTSLLETRYGGGARHDITDAGRMVLVRRVLASLGDEIVYFNRPRRSARFCADCAEALSQLKYCGVGPELLRDAAARRGEKGRKLAELALILTAYEAAREKTGLEAVDRLARAAGRAQPEFFADTAVFVDGFGEFTAPEAALLRCILQGAERVSVTLTCPDDDFSAHRFTVFEPAAATARHLAHLAEAAGVPLEKAVVLSESRRFLTQGLANAERLLAKEKPASDSGAGIRCYGADGIYDEAVYVAACAARLARAGVPYEKMAVVSRDPAGVLPALEYAFGLYHIPLFTGSTVSAEYAPMSVFLRAALGLARSGLSGDGLLALLKTGLCGVSEEAVSALENYCYTWQPKADDWRVPFERNPAGPEAGELGEPEERLLALANTAREAVVPAVERFRVGRGRTGAALSAALYDLLIDVGAKEIVAGWAEQENGKALGSFDAVRMWEAVTGFLDEMARLLGEEEVSPAEYDELLCVLLRSTEIGQAPHTQNEVQLAAADRMRLDNPDYVFVLGLNEDVFPAPVGDSPLLSNDDRALLSELGAPLSGDFENMVLREEMNLYRALTSARKGLVLTWLARKNGAALTVCAPVRALCERLNLSPKGLSAAEIALTPEAAMELLARHYREENAVTASLKAALAESPGMALRLRVLEDASHSTAYALCDTENLRRLLGRDMAVSPTRMEMFYECRFAYFLRYILGIRPRARAELGIPQSGVLVHWLLETMMRDFPSLGALDDDALASEVRRRIDAYVKEHLPFASGTRFAYLIARIGENAAGLLRYMRDEQQQGGFVPCAFEQKIGGADGVPALTLAGQHGETVHIIGQVDRVDVMRTPGGTYLRVVDYKTGSKSFSLDEVCSGLNTQMLLYLFTLTRNGQKQFGPTLPAGVLYLLSDPPTSSDEKRGRYAVDGVVLDDPAVLDGMDRDHTGLYLPFRPGAGGVLHSEKLVDTATLGRLSETLAGLVREMADELYDGRIEAVPLRHHNAVRCDACDYRPVCHHRDGENEGALQTAEKRLAPPEETADAPKGETKK